MPGHRPYPEAMGTRSMACSFPPLKNLGFRGFPSRWPEARRPAGAIIRPSIPRTGRIFMSGVEKGEFSMLDEQGGYPAAQASYIDTSYSASGSVTDTLPVPAPALRRLVLASPVFAGGEGMERVLRHLREHFREDVPMQVLADLVRLSLRQFHRNFKKKFGMPPNQYLIRMRVQAASDLLISDSRPIAEIAYELGFADDTLFIRQFKSRMGMTPLQYRKAKR